MTGTKLSKSEKIWQSIFSNNSENEEFSKNYSETQTDKNWLIPKEPNTVCFWRELYPNKQEIWIDHSYLWTACYSQEEWTEFRNVKFHELVQRFESRGQAFKKIVSDTDKKIEYECDLDNNVKCHLCLFDCLSKNYRGIGIELCNCDFKDERKIKSISGWVAFFTLTLRDIIEELDINNQVYQQLESINISQTSDDNKDEEDCNNDSATDKKLYTYNIELQGTGGEFVLGSIDDETWDYIEEEFDGDAEAYCEALDNEEVPEDFRICYDSNELYENDDLGHYHSWFSNEDFTLTVKQVLDNNDDDKVICVLDNEDNIEIEYQFIQPPTIEDCKHYMTWLYSESGYMSCTLELDEPIDPSKLKLGVKRVLFDEADSCIDCITSIHYEGKSVVLDFDSGDLYFPRLDFYTVPDEDDDEDEFDEE